VESASVFQTTLSSYGVHIGFRAEFRAAARSFERFFPYGSELSGEGAGEEMVDRRYSVSKDAGGKFKLYVNSRKVCESQKANDVLSRFQSHAQLFIAARSRQKAFIHAGVVAVDGRAILIPGYSHAGKSTLVAEFVKAGAIYYSDEYAVLDQAGKAHPYAKPLSIRSRVSGVQRDVAVEKLGGRAGLTPLPVGVILITKYKEGAEWRAKEAGSGEGIKALTLNSVSIRHSPEPTLRSIARAVSGALILKSERGNAHHLVRDVMGKLQG
jgi:hypothetical protein